MFLRRMTNTEKYAGGRGTTTGVARTEKRASGRVRCAKVRSSLGEVCDLSATGAKISCRKKPSVEVGHDVRLELITDENSATVPAKVMWVRVQQDCSFHIGLQFEQMDPLRKKQLMDVVRTGLDSEGLSRGWSPMGTRRRGEVGDQFAT